MKNKKLFISILALIMVGAMLLGLIVSILPRNAGAVTSSELKDQLDALKKEKNEIVSQIKDLEKQQNANREDMEAVMEQKAVIEQQIALLQDEIANVNSQIATYSLLISDKQSELEEAEAHLEYLTEKHRERLRAMEEQGELSYWSVIFKANSFSDLLDRVSMVKEIAAADQRRLQEMNEAAALVAQTQKELETEKLALEESRAELEATQLTLDQKNSEADALLSELVEISEDMNALHDQFEAEEDKFLEQIAQKDKEYNDKLEEERELSRQASIQASIEESIQASIQESVEASIQESIQASIQAAKPSTKPSGSSGGGNSGGSSSSKTWLRPCSYSYVSSPFGYRIHPVTGEYKMHKGVDLVASKGTPIYATRSGYVTIATYHSTAGNYVTLNHQDGYTSVYMHMTHDVVSVGEYVKAGQLIGYVGSTGRSTGPHLHFGIAYQGEYVNPMNYI
jgi:murein DD-endopeptidase MepM/ murein hydrolase activator NlpD